jgi:hypothetical protein
MPDQSPRNNMNKNDESLEKLAYFEVDGLEIETKCQGIVFVFSTLKRTEQVVGTLFTVDNDPFSLRIKTLDGRVVLFKTPVDIYPTLGLITHRNAVNISSGY